MKWTFNSLDLGTKIEKNSIFFIWVCIFFNTHKVKLPFIIVILKLRSNSLSPDSEKDLMFLFFAITN